MAATWPPPPDRESIDELVAAADVEGFLAEGAPADEYESEAEQIFEAVAHFPVEQMTTEWLLPIVERVWQQAFALDDGQMAARSGGLRGLAEQMARFFGPEARPTVRGSART